MSPMQPSRNLDDEFDPREPVRFLPLDATKGLKDGIGLCLSGGGYRAMLFHTGVLWRLHDAGLLGTIKRISSVSGGSIISAWLALNWSRIHGANPEPFETAIVTLIRKLASRTLDRSSILRGLFLPGSINTKVVKALTKHLFGAATLQDLPSDDVGPRFVINATNVQSGALWRFMKPYMRDWRVGEIKSPTISIAAAVAASAAFPPVLSPARLRLNADQFTPGSGAELQRPPFTTNVFLSDGGVYDNLGLETVWKRYKTVLVSDAGGRMKPDGKAKRDWVRHIFRVLGVIDNQVRSLRKRQAIGSFKDGRRSGAFWDMRMDMRRMTASGTLLCPLDKTTELANVKTRLKSLDDRTQERLINWGYAISDASIRTHYNPALNPPTRFPYPAVGV